MKAVATSYELDGRPFPPTLKQRLGSAFVWFGMRLILGKPPKEANIGRRDGTRSRLTWPAYVPPEES